MENKNNIQLTSSLIFLDTYGKIILTKEGRLVNEK